MDNVSFPVGTNSSLLAKSAVMKDLCVPSSRRKLACRLFGQELIDAIAVFRRTLPCD